MHGFSMYSMFSEPSSLLLTRISKKGSELFCYISIGDWIFEWMLFKC
jgi:hypothetical protein